jgi:ABC-2 type transport system permease protein
MTYSYITRGLKSIQEEIIVKSQEPDAWREGLLKLTTSPMVRLFTSAFNFTTDTVTVAELEARKLHHDSTELLTRAVQPALWLLIFGEVLAQIRAIPTGQISYMDFMTPGILAQSVLFIAIFYGIAVIWERDLGILHKMLASPAPRAALVLGKALSAGERGLSQAAIIYLLALLLGVHINWTLLAVLGVLLVVVLGSALFSTFSLIIACLVRTRERFMGVGQLLTMPLFFASNAIYPISLMPSWLQAISQANPLTYEVDALRSLMVIGGGTTYGLLVDLVALLVSTVVLVLIAARLYPRVVV